MNSLGTAKYIRNTYLACLDICSIEDGAGGCKFIEVRCVNLRWAEGVNIISSLQSKLSCVNIIEGGSLVNLNEGVGRYEFKFGRRSSAMIINTFLPGNQIYFPTSENQISFLFWLIIVHLQNCTSQNYPKIMKFKIITVSKTGVCE